MSAIQGLLRVAAQLTPTLKNSKFKETGVLTPEECPTWAWEAGEESKRLAYLPADKQFLVTKRVPCHRRVKAMEYTEEDDEPDMAGEDGEEAWVTTHTNHNAKAEVATELTLEVQKPAPAAAEEEEVDLDNIPDFDAVDLNDNLVEEEDPAALQTTGGDNEIVKSRTYDLSITYDNYYRTPRVWLYGYNEQEQALRPDEIYEDISQDHAKKTVTIEPHPHLNLSMASIHPCKHANVMKRILSHLDENGKELRVDQYMILFLKFVSAIIPTIEYDFTISSDG